MTLTDQYSLDRINNFNPLTCSLEGVHLIEASAGTGKTFAISNIYLRILMHYKHELPLSDLRNILVLTFTRAATQELQSRIRDRIRLAHATLVKLAKFGRNALDIETQFLFDSDPILAELCLSQFDYLLASRNLSIAMRLMDEASIYTIHSLCKKILNRIAFDVDLPFEFNIIKSVANFQLDAVRDFWRNRFYGEDITLCRGVFHVGKNPEELLRLIKRTSSHSNNYPNQTNEVYNTAEMPSTIAVSHEQALFDFNQLKEFWKREVSELSSMADRYGLKKNSYRKDHQLVRIKAVTDWLENGVDLYAPPKALEYFTISKIEQAVVNSGRNIDNPLFYSSERCLANVQIFRQALITEAMSEMNRRVKNKKKENSLISFDDLLEYTAGALRKVDGLSSLLYHKYPIALIDEFQDTDGLQWEIFSSIYVNRSKSALILIGDPKQAIYSFRGADLETYIQAKQIVPSHFRHKLLYNYRSTPQLIKAVNLLFFKHSRSIL